MSHRLPPRSRWQPRPRLRRSATAPRPAGAGHPCCWAQVLLRVGWQEQLGVDCVLRNSCWKTVMALRSISNHTTCIVIITLLFIIVTTAAVLACLTRARWPCWFTRVHARPLAGPRVRRGCRQDSKCSEGWLAVLGLAYRLVDCPGGLPGTLSGRPDCGCLGGCSRTLLSSPKGLFLARVSGANRCVARGPEGPVGERPDTADLRCHGH